MVFTVMLTFTNGTVLRHLYGIARHCIHFPRVFKRQLPLLLATKLSSRRLVHVVHLFRLTEKRDITRMLLDQPSTRNRD